MGKVRITVADPVVDLEVLDARLNTVELGYGRVDPTQLELELEPGLYKVRQSLGGWSSEQLIEVADADQELELDGPAVDPGATRSERIGAPVVDPVSYGEGAQLVVTVSAPERVPAHEAAPWAQIRNVQGPPRSAPLPSEALASVHVARPDHSGRQVLSEGAAAGEGVSVAHLHLDPGPWVLEVRDDLGVTVLHLFLAHDTTTHVSFDLRSEGTAGAVDTTSTRIVAWAGSEPSVPSLDWRTAHLLGVVGRGHGVDDAAAEALLDDALASPLVGLLLLHALLNDAHVDAALFLRLYGATRSLLGGDAPDLVAVAAKARRSTELNPLLAAEVPSLSAAPMLRASWDLIVRATWDDEVTLDDGSPVDALAGHEWGSSPWAWFRFSDAQADEAAEVVQARRALEQAVPAEVDRARFVAQRSYLPKQSVARALRKLDREDP